MKIEQVKTEALIPYGFNNRKHSEQQIDRVANSIAQFGFNQPIVVDEDNIILVGHCRLEAAKKLSLERVPVMKKAGLTEAQKKAYRILDNKLQNDSEWNFESLELELSALEKMDFELEPWGLEELRNLFPEEEPQAEEDDFDETASLESEPFIKRGDLIELGRHRVLCGDSTSAADVAYLTVGGTVDLVVTDPPYGVAYIGKTKDALTLENDDLDEAALDALWKAVVSNWLQITRCGGVWYAAVPAGPLNLVFSLVLRESGVLRQQLVWAKDSMVLGRSDYHYKHEPILYGWKPGAAHHFTNDRTKTSVLEFARPKASREHPTMKPLELWAELIANSSKRGEYVGDPFLGSGTTLIAADQLDRVCYGMEIEPRYCQVIIDRYAKYCAERNKPFECKINGEPYFG